MANQHLHHEFNEMKPIQQYFLPSFSTLKAAKVDLIIYFSSIKSMVFYKIRKYPELIEFQL